MIETPVSLGLSDTESLPPGLLTNGTMFDRQGRWAGGNLVRFANIDPQPMGSWGTLSISPALASSVTDSPQAAFIWTATNGQYVIMGRGNKIYAIKHGSPPHVTTDITPPGMVGLFSESAVATIHFAAFGDNSVLLCRNGTSLTLASSLGIWDPTSGEVVLPITEAGLGLRGVFVTPERFVVVLKAGRNISWASQGTYNLWTPTTTNSAGGLTVQGASPFIAGRAVGSQSLLWSEDDVAVLDYVGAPLYYGGTSLGKGGGLVGPNCVVVVNNTAYWMSAGGFFKYNGFVQPLPCDVADSVFNANFKRLYAARWFAIVNAPANEIWWFYGDDPAQLSPNKLVTYNYVNGTWSLGTLSRSAGTNAEWHDAGSNEIISPILFDKDAVTVYQHELSGAATGASIETGPFRASSGQNTVLVSRLIPDSRTSGDQITLLSGTYPGEAETANGPYTSSGAVPLDTRFRARYVRYKQTMTQASSRVGIPQLGVIPSSSR
jgi:hypothetical protein